ncbi:hypothetical protein AKJ16_DCAP01961 [Drosera capensis]
MNKTKPSSLSHISSVPKYHHTWPRRLPSPSPEPLPPPPSHLRPPPNRIRVSAPIRLLHNSSIPHLACLIDLLRIRNSEIGELVGGS